MDVLIDDSWQHPFTFCMKMSVRLKMNCRINDSRNPALVDKKRPSRDKLFFE
jgi:hypothetical protein